MQKNIFKIILIVFFIFIISKFLQTRLDINYDSVELNANIVFLDEDEAALAHRKLYAVPLYGIIATYFTPKKISLRLLDKLNNPDFCYRDKHAQKRNPKIISNENSITIKLIFIDEKNARKCERQINNYIDAQFKLFLKEAKETIETLKEGKNLIDFNNSNENEIIKEMLNFLDEKTINTLKLQSYFNQSYSIDSINEYFLLINNSKNFKFISSIESNSNQSLNKYQFEILILVISLFLILISFKKEIEIYFNNLKKKL